TLAVFQTASELGHHHQGVCQSLQRGETRPSFVMGYRSGFLQPHSLIAALGGKMLLPPVRGISDAPFLVLERRPAGGRPLLLSRWQEAAPSFLEGGPKSKHVPPLRLCYRASAWGQFAQGGGGPDHLWALRLGGLGGAHLTPARITRGVEGCSPPVLRH